MKACLAAGGWWREKIGVRLSDVGAVGGLGDAVAGGADSQITTAARLAPPGRQEIARVAELAHAKEAFENQILLYVALSCLSVFCCGQQTEKSRHASGTSPCSCLWDRAATYLRRFWSSFVNTL